MKDNYDKSIKLGRIVYFFFISGCFLYTRKLKLGFLLDR